MDIALSGFRGGRLGCCCPGFAGIGVEMAVERAAKREIAQMRMDVVFIFAVGGGVGG